MPCPPQYACRAITRSGRQCSRWQRDSGLCGTHERMVLVDQVDSQTPSQATQTPSQATQTPSQATQPPNQATQNNDPCVECDDECPVCYESTVGTITCPNGHRICGQHYIDDISAMWKNRSNNHIKCFVCRQRISCSQFNVDFITTLPSAYMAQYLQSDPINARRWKPFFQKSIIDMFKMLNYIE